MESWNHTDYQLSLTSRCWAYTPYDAGWQGCPALREDDELRRLHAEELALEPVPSWARTVLERHLTYLPGCPHAAFPLPFVDIFDAIGARACLPFVHSCYTVPASRKERMVPYIEALQDWLAGRPGTDGPGFRVALWEVLGSATPTKRLLVERLVHRLKWWCKAMTWDDDARDRFYQDDDLGDICCRGNHYGNPRFRDPYWTELRAPRVQELETQLAALCPEWPWFRDCIHSTWLCGPKAFRYVERILWCIGQVEQADNLVARHQAGELDIPFFLDCADTYAGMVDVAPWFTDAVAVCRAFRSGGTVASPRQADLLERLRGYGPAKAWLVGLFARKLALMPYAQIA